MDWLSKEFQIYSALFGYVLGLFVWNAFTENTEAGWTDVVLKLSFLAYPLMFGVLQEGFIGKKQIIWILNGFIIITTSSVLFSLAHAAYEYWFHQDTLAFFYARLSFLIHPSYYALYVNFALIAVLCRLFKISDHEKGVIYIAYWILIPVYIVFLILLESKAGLLGLISVMFLSFMHLIFNERNIKHLIKLVGLSFVTVLLTLFLLPQTTERVNQVVESMDKKEDASQHSATAARIYLWKAAYHSILEKPIFGYSTGDVKEELLRQYEIQQNSRALEMNYNSHNQYLQTTVATGVLGLLSLLLLVGFPMIFSFKRKILFYFLLGFLMAINLVVESMFERQAGVMFYAFFNALVFFVYKSDDSLFDKSDA